MANKKQNYFCALFKSGYIIHTLLFAALACTLLVFGYTTNLWGLIFNNLNFLIPTAVTVGLFSFLTFIYILANAKKSKICATDALALALTITSIFYLLFVILVLKGYTTPRIVAVVLTLALGLILVVTNACKFNPDLKEQEKPVKNTLKAYFQTVFEKFSFIGILIATAVIVSFGLIFLLPSYSFSLSNGEYVYAAFLTIPAIIWLACSVSSKKVGAFDALLIALYIAAPIMLVLIISMGGAVTNLILWAFALLAGLILTYFRYTSFDVTFVCDKPIEKANPFIFYVKTVAKKYNLLLTVAIGGLLALSVFVLFPVGVATKYLKITAEHIYVSPVLFFVATVQLATFGTLFMGALLSCTNVEVKKVNLADFLLLVLASFVILGAIDILVVFSIKKLVAILLGFAFVCVVLVKRIRTIYENA